MASSVLGANLLHVCLQPGLLPAGRGGAVTKPCWGHGPPSHCPPEPRYWCCRPDEREAGLEGWELPLGACRARGSSG